MACDLCNCDDHPHSPCATCLNCVGHYRKDSDYDQVHTDHTATSTEHTQDPPTVGPKPHYRYDARRGAFVPKNQPAKKIAE